jgi:tetratricopeptide (TPR) repeat protein
MKVRTAFRLGALFALLFVISSCGGPEEKKTRYFEKGKALYEQGDYVNARLELKNAVQIDPKFTQAHYLLGMVALQSGNAREAFGSLSKAASLDPLHLDAHLQLGKMLLASRQPDQALEKAEIILREKPDHEEALILKGAALLAHEESGPSAALLEGLLAGGSTRADVYHLLAFA